MRIPTEKKLSKSYSIKPKNERNKAIRVNDLML